MIFGAKYYSSGHFCTSQRAKILLFWPFGSDHWGLLQCGGGEDERQTQRQREAKRERMSSQAGRSSEWMFESVAASILTEYNGRHVS